jgi:hypothetical protein
MAGFGLMRGLWDSRSVDGTAHFRRPAIGLFALAAIILGHLAVQPVAADDFPKPLAANISGAPGGTSSATTVNQVFSVDSPQPALWLANPGSQSQLVAVDGEQPAPAGLQSVLAHWETVLWRPERPAVVLTAYESSADAEEAPLMPEDPVGSNLQPVDACERPPIRFSDDAWAFLPRLGHDAWGLVNWDDAIILGVALGGSLALRGEVDQSVRNWTAEHPDRWGEGSKLLGDLGVVQYQIPVIFGVYAFTLWHQDAYEHDMMTSMISAYTIFGVSTLGIKLAADTNRPSDTWNGGKYGFPSWHDGSLFCISAVIDEYEGHWIGVPLYIVSGLVGWSRIDTRDHDLSDVVFGGVLGYVIGKSVAGRALYGDSRVHILPYVHPSEGEAGVMFDVSY